MKSDLFLDNLSRLLVTQITSSDKYQDKAKETKSKNLIISKQKYGNTRLRVA